MKKLLYILLVPLLSSEVFAQKSENIKNSFKINALGIIPGFYELQYERVISPKGTIKVGFGTGTLVNRKGSKADKDFRDALGISGFLNSEHIVKGFTINADYRYFFSHHGALKGLYVGPAIQYLKLNEKYTYTDIDNVLFTPSEIDYSIFNIRALCGYQFIIAKAIALNPYVGVGFALGDVDENNSNVEAFGTGITLNAGIDIGIVF